MARIIVDSASLVSVLNEIESCCRMLGYCSCDEDTDDVEYYALRIRRAADDLRSIIKSAEPSEGVKT